MPVSLYFTNLANNRQKTSAYGICYYLHVLSIFSLLLLLLLSVNLLNAFFLTAQSRRLVIAKFHYTGPTGPGRTRTDPHGPERTGADFVRDPHGPTEFLGDAGPVGPV